MNKKNKKRLMAAASMGALGFLGSKMAGAGAASALNRPNMRNIAGEKKKSILEKILNMSPGRNATSSKGGTLASSILSKNPFGLGAMDGAKYGKMIKAKKGTYVTASCKLGRNKKTIIT